MKRRGRRSCEDRQDISKIMSLAVILGNYTAYDKAKSYFLKRCSCLKFLVK